MSLAQLCRFPITCYEGEYRPTWTRHWTRLGGAGGSWQFFGHARDIILDNDGEPYTWEGEFGFHGFHGIFPMLAGPRNDWGAFDLVGLLQMDRGRNIHKACGSVTLRDNDLRVFVAAGTKVNEHRETGVYRMTPDVFCIAGVGGRINLTLVTMNNRRIEVYFLSGRDTGEWRSKLPGMDEFYRAAKFKKFFANFANLFSGVCGQRENCDDELWRRTGDRVATMDHRFRDVYENIAGYVTDRRSAHTAHNVNSLYRNKLGCAVGCPLGQKCYPAGNPAGAADGCVIGRRRPDRPHCCQFTMNQTFIMTVREMHFHAISASTNRGPASLEYIYELGSLIHPYMDHHIIHGFVVSLLNTHSPRFVGLNLNTLFAQPQEYYQVWTDLSTIASNLFERVHFKLDVAFPWIETVQPLIRYDGNHFFSMSESNGLYVTPLSILSVATNVRATSSVSRFTEQHLFDILVAKLRDNRSGDQPGTSVINMPYSNVQTADFAAIQHACIDSPFRGRIVCALHPDTIVQTGTHSGISFTVEPSGWTRLPVNVIPGTPDGFGEITANAFALIIHRA